MPKVSVIVPARGESDVLQRTVADVYAKATGSIEVLVGFDGPPYQTFPAYPGLRVLAEPLMGLKPMLNKLAAEAQGDYLLKTDAHCMFGPGFDEILADHMQPNWIVTPRFYVLDAARWAWQDGRFYDYFYLSCPFTDKRGFRFKAGGHWPDRTTDRLDGPALDETPQFHGSAWFVGRDFFLNSLGGFPTDDPFGHAQEPPNLGLKTWLGPWGGAVMVNKLTWYAHMHQDNRNRGYRMGHQNEENTYRQVANYWVGNEWAGRAHDFAWFVEKFYPMPTWPENWRELLGVSSERA